MKFTTKLIGLLVTATFLISLMILPVNAATFTAQPTSSTVLLDGTNVRFVCVLDQRQQLLQAA